MYIRYAVTKPGNNHKWPQATNNWLQTSTNHQQVTKIYQQTTTNGHTCTSNWKSDILFLLPAPDNYKEHSDFEKHTLQCQISGWGVWIVGWDLTKVSSINKWGVLIKGVQLFFHVLNMENVLWVYIVQQNNKTGFKTC